LICESASEEELPEPLGFSWFWLSLVCGSASWEELPEPLGFSSLLLSSCCFWLSIVFFGG
ncbi:hypothetical protein, partial [Mycoplasmopsis bovis]